MNIQKLLATTVLAVADGLVLLHLPAVLKKKQMNWVFHCQDHYIDETMKNKNGKYVLPSNKWKHINSDMVFFIKRF